MLKEAKMIRRLLLVTIVGLPILLLACAPGQRLRGDALLPPTAAPSSTALVQTPQPTDPFAATRLVMVRDQIAARGVTDPATLDAMRRVPRHRFVLSQHLDSAYADHPLPIGYGQTISQPYIVALMTEAIKVGPGNRVLEIGAGSGYQAAILADLGAEVFTIEIIPELASSAAARLRELGYDNVKVLNADGYFGWPEHAPFDAIIVTAAPDHLPQPLANQLVEGGRLIIPIGPQGSFQTLWLFEKRGGELAAANLGAVVFVPLTGKR
jgi:protein-L-isoaspartate(D-aspartate) O-methyltransferase